MQSLRWVDKTYIQKHNNDDPSQLRNMYYPNLSLYQVDSRDLAIHSHRGSPLLRFVARFARKGAMSLIIFVCSYIPYIGRAVLPAASFYTLNKTLGMGPSAVIFGAGVFVPRRYMVIFLQTYFASRSLMRELLEPYFARIHFTKEQKRQWFRSREGVLFGFGLGFYCLVKTPLVGVLIYGIAEASTAYLITKITDPPPPPSATSKELKQYTDEQQVWKNKHKFVTASL